MLKHLLLLPIMLVSFFTAGAQTGHIEKQEALHNSKNVTGCKAKHVHPRPHSTFTNTSPVQNHKTDALQQRLTGYRMDSYTDGSLQAVDSNTWTYSGNRGAVFAGNLSFDTRNRWILSNGNIVPDYRQTIGRNGNGLNADFLEEDYVSGAFENNTRLLYTYDAKANLIKYTTQAWKAGTWNDSLKFDFTYDSNNQRITETASTWNGAAWKISYRYSYAYDNQNNVVEQILEQDKGSGLVNIRRYAHSYDPNGDVLIDLSQNWVGSAWVNDIRFVFTYNTGHQLTCSDLQDWIAGAWITDNKWDYVFDGGGLLTLDAWSKWEANTWDTIAVRYSFHNGLKQLIEDTTRAYNNNIPQNSSRTTYTYDANGNTDVTTYYSWVNNAWQNRSRSNYDYNLTYNNFVHSLTEQWNTSSWRINSETFHYYGTYDAPSAINDIGSSIQFVAYPNPACNVLNIDFTATTAGESNLHVFNLNGQQVLSSTFRAAIGDNYRQLDIAALPAGLYMVELMNGNNFAHLKFSKQ